MKTIEKNSISYVKRAFQVAGGVLVVSLLLASAAFASAPSLVLYTTGNNSVQLTVTGDVNSAVNFYYYSNGSSSLSSTNLGSTNSNGSFITTMNTGNYNIQPGSMVYVVVNGAQSTSQNWPYYNGGNNNNNSLYLSQNSISLNAGQSSYVTISGNSYNNGSYYLTANTNSAVASATLSGNRINIYGYTPGSTTITVCENQSGNGSCGTLYVTVNGYNNSGSLSLSQNNITLASGQRVTDTVYGGTNIYYVSSNSNPDAVYASINGNTITLYGEQTGTSVLSICSSASSNNYNYNSNNYLYNNCVSLTVNVNGSYNNNYYPPTTYYTPPTLASGVFLSQIPYTGARPNLGVTLFIIGLMLWSAFLAYMIITKRNQAAFATAGTHGPVSISERIAQFKKENRESKRIAR